MQGKVARVLNITSTVIVGVMVAAALFLMGMRLFGFQPFAVISPSMTDTYNVGDLIYVQKNVDPATVKEGDVITYVLNEQLDVCTHRVVDIKTNEKGELLFVTKGDQNNIEDPNPVHEENLIGKPVFAIPLVGYFSVWIKTWTGKIVGGVILLLLIVLVFLPTGKDPKKEREAAEVRQASADSAEEARRIREELAKTMAKLEEAKKTKAEKTGETGEAEKAGEAGEAEKAGETGETEKTGEAGEAEKAGQ